MLNPLEILRSGEDDYTSYANHISKLQSFFKCIIPSMSDHLLQELANQLREFYAKYQLVPSDENIITGLEAAEYPTLSDLRQYLENFIRYTSEKDAQSTTDVETTLNVEKAKNLSIILSAVENLCNNFGNMFDGHIVVVSDMLDQQGRPVILAIQANVTAKVNNVSVLTNSLNSAYGRNGFDLFIQHALEENRILYVGKKISHQILQSPQLQLLSGLQSGDYVDNVAQFRANVNTENLEVQEADNTKDRKPVSITEDPQQQEYRVASFSPIRQSR